MVDKWKDSTRVYQYKLTGEFIAEWISAKEAAHVLGISETSIYQSCRSDYRAGNFQFKTFKNKLLIHGLINYLNKYLSFLKQLNLLLVTNLLKKHLGN